MSYAWERLIERVHRGGGSRAARGPVADHTVVIRPARDTDLPLLLDLAELDSAPPLVGATLVAFVDGRPWAAHSLEDDRVVADPFAPSAQAVGLLRLRGRQLRAAQAQAPRTRRLARRVRA